MSLLRLVQLGFQAMESASVMFHRPASRDRFKYKCMGADVSALADEWFSTGPPLLEGGRVWGTVVEMCTYFTDRRGLIELYWDGATMGGRQQAPQLDASDLDFHAQQSQYVAHCTEAFSDPYFWAFIGFISTMHSLIAGIEHWVLACPCHTRSLRELLNLHSLKLQCPLRGFCQ